MPPPPIRQAFLGVRACDLAAVDIQHKVFAATDPSYGRKLETAFVIGVHCQTAAATCFCPSTGTGPEFLHPQWLDLLLTEICDGDDHYFLLQPHSSSGAELVEELPLQPAEPADAARITQQLQNTRSRIDKTLPGNAYEVLSHAQQSPQWDAVAERCLACGNCTYVCPTCFCSDVEDHTDVTGTAAQRWQVWDSCFNAGHSYTHAGVVRNTTRARYRQWLTHKLATWHEQFGTSGCVGCGRCVTWCPVGIDLTQEVAALSAAQDHEH